MAQDAQSQLRCVLRQRIEASLTDDHDLLFSNLDELLQSNQRMARRLRELEYYQQYQQQFSSPTTTTTTTSDLTHMDEENDTPHQEMKGEVERLQAIELEMNKLREARDRQEVLVKQLVRQRDLYRSLLVEQTSRSQKSTSTTTGKSEENNPSNTDGLISKSEQLILLQDELAKAKAELVDKEALVDRAQRSLETVKRSEEELRSQLLHVQREMTSKTASISQLESTTSSLQDEARRKQQLIDQLQQELSSSQHQLEHLQTELETLRSNHQAQTEALEGWHAEKSGVASLLAQAQADAERSTKVLLEKVEMLEKEVARLEQEVATRDSRVEEMAAVEVVRLEEVG